MEIDEQLKQFENQKGKNWQRLIFVLRKHLDIWAHRHIKPRWGQMKISYWPVICNIAVEGSTAMEIARRSMIVKQTMSRTIKELEEKGMLFSETSKSDKRSECLYLTPSGKQLILDSNIELAKLMDTYKELVGEKNLDIAFDVLNKIINYHESLNTHDDDNDDHFGD
ncbi:DNA-binding transcriptional regulator, MarR family [Chitinophaga sp. CF118]|uniref:MarR family winged helix-turn-helix transcriptional regulator n=1 Tax=Chitinophaga sp. CF118 TaxID=1884367 RepID=UPI0008E2AC32|nr:MarR family transcriptional regulator [Chitinophaga sp. CF118]SFD15261.1 DNA-binding transcriptional regulator, MarR family [Chitinophaga sp. CF118]